MHIYKVQRKVHFCNSLYIIRHNSVLLKENMPYCSGEHL